ANPLALQPVRAPDHVEHDLVRAGADPVEARVAIGALDLVLLHVPVAAMDLDRLVGDLLHDARAIELRLRDLAHRVLAVGVAPGGRIDHLLRGLDLHRHLGELVADRLEPPDRAAEGLALLGVLERALEDALGARDAADRGDQALALELPADVVEALALLTQHVLGGGADGLEGGRAGVRGGPPHLLQLSPDAEHPPPPALP